MYTSTTYGSYEGCKRFNFGGSSFTSMSNYIADYWGTNTGYDIAYLDGNIWAAVNDATSPIRCYEATSGGVLEAIPASIGIGSNIRGMTCETGTDAPFIWASNPTTDELYRIDLNPTGTAEGSSGIVNDPTSITFSQNPFHSSTVIHLSGFSGEVSLEIFDFGGRKVLSETAEGSLVFNGESLPSGTYLIRATDGAGQMAASSLVKL